MMLRARILTVVLVLSLVFLAYPVWRVCGWLGLPGWACVLVTLPLFLSQLIARLLLRSTEHALVRTLRLGADFYLGISPVLLVAVLCAEVLVWGQLLAPQLVAWLVICAGVGAGMWGTYKAWVPRVITVSLSSPKLTRPVRFAQISDVHIGSRTPKFLRQVMAQVNALEPEFLCITGDFIDARGVSEGDLSSLRDFKGPIFFCTGNHEHYEDLEDILTRLGNLGVQVLRGRHADCGELQIIGFDDHADPDRLADALTRIDIDSARYSILMYHRPHGLHHAARHGIDLKLSGHTHNGQIKPFHWAVKSQFKYVTGLYQIGSTHLYVNQGTGTWGPVMRLGTYSEITAFQINPA